MLLEQQVCSLELARRLKELGVKQSSLFVYSEIETVPRGREYRIYYAGINEKHSELDHAAFTASELLEILPDSCSLTKSTDGERMWFCTHRSLDKKENIWMNSSLPNVLAEMLIHLIETGVVKNDLQKRSRTIC